MADNKINITVSANTKKNITVTSSQVSTEITASTDTGRFWAQTSKNWAISDVIVDNTDYSSKHYAQEAKTSAQNASNSEVSTRESYNSFLETSANAVTEIQGVKEETLTEIDTSKTNAVNSINTVKNNAVDSINSTKTTILNDIEFVADGEKKEIEDLIDSGKEELKEAIGDVKVLTTLEIGDIGFTQMAIDESKGKRRALNKVDNIIIQEQYPELTKRIKATQALDPDLFCTESEWQTELTMSANGVCYKYVIDDEAGTIRLPKYPDYLDLSINGAKTVSVYGNGKTLGLTDGATNYGLGSRNDGMIIANSTAYNTTAGTSLTSGKGTQKTYGVVTNASKSGLTGSVTTSSEKIKGTYFIQVATGAETEDNIVNEIELNNPFFLGMSQYFETEPNNVSWLKSEGQWNSKAIYPSFYELLLKEYNNPDRFATFNKDAFTVVGTPTITDDGVASGFSDNNYLTFPISVGNNSWEMVLKLNLTSISRNSDVFGSNDATSPSLALTVLNGLLTLSIGNGSTWQLTNIAGVSILNINTDYFIKISYDTLKYKLQSSTDNQTWTNEAEYTSSTPIGITNLKLGVSRGGTGQFNGSIDLKQFSITVDGNKVFSGANSKVKKTTETFTDYDFVLNTAEETFRLPIKVKLASGKAVVGNGMALGLTDGTVHKPAGYANPALGLSANTDYGLGVSTTLLSYTGKTIGVDTDPTKSGLELSDSDLYLYFYVGETVQNANLVNIGRIQETYTTKSMVDGQWIHRSISLCSNSNVSSTLTTYDVSNYLPNDGYVYEVIGNLFLITGTASGNTVKIKMGTDIMNSRWVAGTQTRSASAVINITQCSMVVGNGRQIVVISDSTDVGKYSLQLTEYRRIGTNL